MKTSACRTSRDSMVEGNFPHNFDLDPLTSSATTGGNEQYIARVLSRIWEYSAIPANISADCRKIGNPVIFMDREAREIMYLVPSVRLSLRPSIRPSVCRLCRVRQRAKKSHYQAKVFVCVLNSRADAVDRLLMANTNSAGIVKNSQILAPAVLPLC